MSRLFDRTASEYLAVTSPVISAVPFTFACWFLTSATVNDQTLMAIGDTATDNHAWTLELNNVGVPQDLRFRANVFGSVYATATVSYAASTWQHGAAVAVSATERHCYLNGRNKGTNNVNKAPAGVDTTGIGVYVRLALANYMNGRIAEAVVLRIAATDHQVWLHAQGVPAPVVWPGWAIAAYYPLFETDRDFPVGNYNMTPFNTPSWAPHPPKVLAWWRKYMRGGTA